MRHMISGHDIALFLTSVLSILNVHHQIRRKPILTLLMRYIYVTYTTKYVTSAMIYATTHNSQHNTDVHTSFDWTG